MITYCDCILCTQYTVIILINNCMKNSVVLEHELSVISHKLVLYIHVLYMYNIYLTHGAEM